ncbi:hypothetical protein [Allokutzneria oryzae]|uniref:Uncharacterized protein n=1 Tax=Allokutzneria oryzae TaxID=1378989 RepID=A0ABV5ZU94_9PSEU
MGNETGRMALALVAGGTIVWVAERLLCLRGLRLKALAEYARVRARDTEGHHTLHAELTQVNRRVSEIQRLLEEPV